MTDVEHISRKGTAVPISWFPIPEEAEFSDYLSGLFGKAREKIRFVPNVFRADPHGDGSKKAEAA
jgi:hypothetical protein